MLRRRPGCASGAAGRGGRAGPGAGRLGRRWRPSSRSRPRRTAPPLGSHPRRGTPPATRPGVAWPRARLHRAQATTSFSIHDGPPFTLGTRCSVAAATSPASTRRPHHTQASPSRPRIRRLRSWRPGAAASPVVMAPGCRDRRTLVLSDRPTGVPACAPCPTDASPPAPPGRCTSATCARRWWRGCSPASDGSPVPAAHRRPRPRASRTEHEAGHWPTCGPWASTATGRAAPVERRTSTRTPLDRLVNAGRTYPCYCTRREVRRGHPRPPRGRCPTGPTRAPAAISRRPSGPSGRPPGADRRCACGPRAGRGLRRPAGGVQGAVDDWCSAGPTGCRPTTSWWWWTTPPRASARWCGATTCWTPRPARSTSPACWDSRRRPTPTCPWCSAPTATDWPSATARSPWPTSAREGGGPEPGALTAARLPRPPRSTGEPGRRPGRLRPGGTAPVALVPDKPPGIRRETPTESCPIGRGGRLAAPGGPRRGDGGPAPTMVGGATSPGSATGPPGGAEPEKTP